jgi:hypothetical protein
VILGQTWSILESDATRTEDLPTLYAQVTAHERLFHVNMLNLDLHVVNLALRLLRAVKTASRTEIGRWRLRYRLGSVSQPPQHE